MIDLSMLEAIREAGICHRAAVQRRKHKGLGLRSVTHDQPHAQVRALKE